MAVESERLRKLRDYLNEKLHNQLDELYINGRWNTACRTT